MALAFRVDSLEGVDESQQGFYEKVGDSYQLKIDGLPEGEDVSGLKSALDKEREAAREASRKLKELQAQREEDERKSLESKEQYKELYEKARVEKDELSKKLQDEMRGYNADLIVTSLTDDSKKAELLRAQVLKYLEYEEGRIVVAGRAGVEDIAQLKDYLKEEYPFLTSGSKAAGGGAAGDGGGMPTGTDWRKMHPVDRITQAREGKIK